MLNRDPIPARPPIRIPTVHRARAIRVAARHGAVRTRIVRPRGWHRLGHGPPILGLVCARVLVSAVGRFAVVVVAIPTVCVAVDNSAHFDVGRVLRAVPSW